jgi:transcriptional regulator with XRE-family HTH domain
VSASDGGSEFRQAAARWLRAASQGPDGRDRIPFKELAKKAKVSRTTLWRINTGEADVAPETLERLAKALKVTPPKVTMTLVLDGSTAPRPQSAIGMVREAHALLADALRALGVDEVDDK